jgi:hypothetical protein
MVMRVNYEQMVGRVANTGNFGGSGDAFVVSVVDKCQLTFGTAGTTDVNLAQNIPTARWVSGVLITRIFTAATFVGTLNIYVVNSFIGEDDPATIFGPVVPTTTFVAKSVNITNTPSAITSPDTVRLIHMSPPVDGVGRGFFGINPYPQMLPAPGVGLWKNGGWFGAYSYVEFICHWAGPDYGDTWTVAVMTNQYSGRLPLHSQRARGRSDA